MNGSLDAPVGPSCLLGRAADRGAISRSKVQSWCPSHHLPRQVAATPPDDCSKRRRRRMFWMTGTAPLPPKPAIAPLHGWLARRSGHLTAAAPRLINNAGVRHAESGSRPVGELCRRAGHRVFRFGLRGTRVLEDVTMSIILGGLLFVFLISLRRSPQAGVARRTRQRTGRGQR